LSHIRRNSSLINAIGDGITPAGHPLGNVWHLGRKAAFDLLL
jgi:hypothetical protein